MHRFIICAYVRHVFEYLTANYLQKLICSCQSYFIGNIALMTQICRHINELIVCAYV